MTVLNEAALTGFAKKYSASRGPLARFVALVRNAAWPHFAALRQSFPSADYTPATETVIFNVGGNKYRVATRINFETQELLIMSVLTHKEYDRKDF